MDDVEDPRWLEFKSWWTEKGTKRHIDIKFDRLSGQSEVVIDSAAPVLNSTSKYNQLSESMLEVIEPTMLTTSVDIFAPHGEKARAFDFFVGARFKVLGRNVTLMQCGRKTGVWLNSIAARIAAIRTKVAKGLEKFESVPTDLTKSGSGNDLTSSGTPRGREWAPLSSLPSSFGGRNGVLPSSPRSSTQGTTHLRAMFIHATQLAKRLRNYNRGKGEEVESELRLLIEAAALDGNVGAVCDLHDAIDW
mmetsp:Transcript_11964/g.32398  ORF Transcript_11964/g.32398 Transcript_11964/m.32398 type:complete len:248 (-) Transcript_11964:2878-3621(-)